MSKMGLSCSLALNGVTLSAYAKSSSLCSLTLEPDQAPLGGSRPNRTIYWSLNKKCRIWDSNPQGVNHTNLNRARLPIPPLRHIGHLFLVRYSIVKVYAADVFTYVHTLSKNNTQLFFSAECHFDILVISSYSDIQLSRSMRRMYSLTFIPSRKTILNCFSRQSATSTYYAIPKFCQYTDTTLWINYNTKIIFYKNSPTY